MVGSIKAGVMSNPMFIKRPRNVRNPKGVRIRAALRAAAGLLLFFLLLRSDVLPLWVCGVLLAASILLGICDVYADYRRKRPRQRWRDAWLMLLCLSLVMASLCRRSSLRRLRTTGRRPACCSGLVPCRLPLAFTACGAGGACAPMPDCGFGNCA